MFCIMLFIHAVSLLSMKNHCTAVYGCAKWGTYEMKLIQGPPPFKYSKSSFFKAENFKIVL